MLIQLLMMITQLPQNMIRYVLDTVYVKIVQFTVMQVLKIHINVLKAVVMIYHSFNNKLLMISIVNQQFIAQTHHIYTNI